MLRPLPCGPLCISHDFLESRIYIATEILSKLVHKKTSVKSPKQACRLGILAKHRGKALDSSPENGYLYLTPKSQATKGK